MNERNIIAGLKVDPITKKEFLDSSLTRLKTGQKTFVITPYSEFLYHAFQDPKLLEVFNAADFSLPDGIGIFWAKKYLDIPLTAKSYWGKILQGLWQLIYSLAAIVFNPKWIKSAFPEKLVGADLIWDLADMAAKNNLTVFLLGGFGDTAKKAADQLISKSAEWLNIVGWSNKNPNDLTVIENINQSNADILLVAYGPIKQEKWIYENLPNLNVKLAIGVGGTFDYISGSRQAPPAIIRSIGLEWFWRLITQPYRLKRILNATFGLANRTWRYKIFESLPLRQNAVGIVLNDQNKVLIGKRRKRRYNDKLFGYNQKDIENYWQFPQGGVGENENFDQAAKREILEEMGVKNIKKIYVSRHLNVYHWQNALRPFFRQYSRQAGQEQHIIYFKQEGSSDKIKIDGEEFENYQWVEPNNLTTTLHPERLNLAKIVHQDLKEMQEKAII